MLSIAQKAAELGVSIVTLRRWHQKGLLCPDFITPVDTDDIVKNTSGKTASS